MNKHTRKVLISPMPRTSAQGRHKQTYQTVDENGVVTTTVNLNKTREYGTTVTYMFPHNSNTNKLHTGLDKMVVNPFKGLDINDIIETYSPHSTHNLTRIITQDKITKQTLIEIKHGVASDYYNSNMGYTMINMPSRIDDFDKGKGFLANFKLVLYPNTNRFTDETPRQELAIILLDALVEAGRIAKSKAEGNSAVHEFYISEDGQAEMEFANKREKVEEAIYMAYDLKLNSPQFKSYQFAIVLTDARNNSIYKGQNTISRVKSSLSNYLQDRNKDQEKNIDKFVELYNLSKTPEGGEKVEVMYSIQQALNNNIIVNRDNSYIWNSKYDDRSVHDLSPSYNKVISFFLKEYQAYNPKSKAKNYYSDLLQELKSKGVIFQ
jgi:hypothetical protein